MSSTLKRTLCRANSSHASVNVVTVYLLSLKLMLCVNKRIAGIGYYDGKNVGCPLVSPDAGLHRHSILCAEQKSHLWELRYVLDGDISDTYPLSIDNQD